MSESSVENYFLSLNICGQIIHARYTTGNVIFGKRFSNYLPVMLLAFMGLFEDFCSTSRSVKKGHG